MPSRFYLLAAAIIGLSFSLLGAAYSQNASGERSQPRRQDGADQPPVQDIAEPVVSRPGGRFGAGQGRFRERPGDALPPPTDDGLGDGGAFGGPGMGAEARWFHTADRDGDGKVTLEEFLTAQKEVFQRLDKNADGVLTPEEFRRPGLDTPITVQPLAPPAGRHGGSGAGGERRGGGGGAGGGFGLGGPGMGGMGGGGMGRPGGPGTGAEIRWFHAADRDGDGKVTLDEFVDFQKEIFKRLDRNDDGVLTPDEFQRADLAPQGDVPPMGWGRLDGPGPMPASIHPEALVQRLVAQRDRDGNGALSLEEFGADRKALFEALDRNNDGVVTVQDIITAIRDNPRALRLLGGLTVSGDGPHGPAGMGPGMGMGLGPGGQAGPGGQRRMETPESVGSANQDQTARDTQRPRQRLTDPQ